MRSFLHFFFMMTMILTLNLEAATDLKTLLSAKTYTIAGTFGAYDFAPSGDKNPFDWAFTTAKGDSYQLQGNAPTDNDVFGWKKVTITATSAAWYMFPVDVDGDGSIGKFDWILVGAGFKAVYKLAGVSDKGTFEYSSKIDLDYAINGTQVIFEDIDDTGIPAEIETTPAITASADARNWMVTISFAAPGLITYKSSSSTIKHPLYFQGQWNAAISYNSKDTLYNNTLMRNMLIQSTQGLNASEITEFDLELIRYQDTADSWIESVQVFLEFTADLGNTPKDTAVVGNAFGTCSSDIIDSADLEKLKNHQAFEVAIQCSHLTYEYEFSYTLSFDPN